MRVSGEPQKPASHAKHPNHFASHHHQSGDLDRTSDDDATEFTTQADLEAYIANLESDLRKSAKNRKAAKIRDTTKDLHTKEFLLN